MLKKIKNGIKSPPPGPPPVFRRGPGGGKNTSSVVFWDKSITMTIGYRYQKPEGGFFFRADYTPMLNFEGSEFAEKPIRFFPFNVGISLGKSF